MTDQAVNCEANIVNYLPECVSASLHVRTGLLPICESDGCRKPNPATELQIPWILSSTGDDWSLLQHQLASEVVFQDWGSGRLPMLIRATSHMSQEP